MRENMRSKLIFCLMMCCEIILLPLTNSKVVHLHGAGASFPSEVYSRWIAAYKQYRAEYVTLNMTYDSIGSGAGRQLIKEDIRSERPIIYAGSDIPLTDEEQNEYPDLKAFPVMAGNIAISYNIKNIDNLNLTLDTLIGIYNGTIQSWNDSSILTSNPTAPLPNENIEVIARSDNSGTTYAFSSVLSNVSAAWRDEYGIFSEGLDAQLLPVKWNRSAVHYYGYTNRGMSGLIISISNSLGYTTLADSYSSKLKYALIRNHAGNFVHPATRLIENEPEMNLHINFSEEFTYPISAFTFFIAKLTQIRDCSSAIEFVRYVDWFYNSESAKSMSLKLNMLPVDNDVVDDIVSNTLQKLTCHTENVWMLVQQQILQELPEQNNINFVYIFCSVLSLLVISLAVFIGRRWWLVYRMIMKDSLVIKYSAIRFDTENLNKCRPHISSSQVDPVVNINHANKDNNDMRAKDDIKHGMFGSDTVYLITSDSEVKVNAFKVRKLLIWFRDSVNHVNVAKYVGLTKSSLRWYSIYKGQTRGSVVDIIHNPKLNMGTPGLIVLCKEVILGMEYLHEKGIIHGNLRGSCCSVDITWKVKIGGWHQTRLNLCEGINNLSKYQLQNKTDDDTISLYWVAPELIQFQKSLTNEIDVYSFGIVMQEIFSKNMPYCEIQLPPRNIISAVLTSSLRPTISASTPVVIRELMERSWNKVPEVRPTFRILRREMDSSYPDDNSLTDCITRSIEDYVLHLEQELEESKRVNNKAKQTNSCMLLETNPTFVVERFLNNLPQKSIKYQTGTVLVCSIVNLAQFIEVSNPDDVISALEQLITAIDQIVSFRNVHKSAMNGENMLFAPELHISSLSQVRTISSCALMIISYFDRFYSKRPISEALTTKMAIATGSVVEGVLGKNLPIYTVVGEAVTEVFRLLPTTKPNTIQLCRNTYVLLQQLGDLFETYEKQAFQKNESDSSFWLHHRKCVLIQ